jgi:hypothetical protein
MSEEGEEDDGIAYPAIDRAMKILSNRLRVGLQREEETRDNDCSAEEDTVANSLGLLEVASSESVFYNQYILEENGVSERFEDMVPGVTPVQDHQKSSNQSVVSCLQGLNYLARQQFRKQEKIPEVLSKKAKVLEKALSWCWEWSLKRKAFVVIEQFVCDRLSFKKQFKVILSQLFTNANYTAFFSEKMKASCKNRYGKLRVSELYRRWRIKRKYLAMWLNYLKT